MMSPLHNPRSTLHALVPHGMDTPDVESLTSYFCRLAFSHSLTARNFAVWVLEYAGQAVPEDYRWFRKAFSGMSAETEQWVVWLAGLTGIAGLDRLTLLPWRHLVTSQGFAPQSDRWCPCCLQEDRETGRSPYLRLSWDIAQVRVCSRHKVELVSACPCCQRTNVRNRASTVVPGYCTSCGAFLGDTPVTPATPEALWVARQVGQMLAVRPKVAADRLVPLLEVVIARMGSGCVATFARELGLSKSGVWHWVRQGGQPTLQAWLAIALHGGIGLKQLFASEVDDWQLPEEPAQLTIPWLASPRKGIVSKHLDWPAIREQLREVGADIVGRGLSADRN